MDKFVSPQQTGFVPGRQITDNARLCQLLQACLEQNNQKGLMLFLDLEKAFNRVSHTYLADALKAAGLGKTMRLWICSPEDPMRIK